MTKKILIAVACVLSLAACKKDRTPGTTTVGIGVNYKASGTIDSATWINNANPVGTFSKITFNLDSIAKIAYASSASPSSSEFVDVTIHDEDHYWYENFHNDVMLYVSAPGVAEKLFGSATVPDEDVHDLVVKPNSDVKLSDYIGKGSINFRAVTELYDSTDLTDPIPVDLKCNTKLVF
jgi:hypothetical protein